MTTRTIGLMMALLAMGCMSHTRGEDAGPPTGDAGPPSDDAGPPGECTLEEPEVHRAGATVCEMDRPPGSVSSEAEGECGSDADCTDGTNGRCHHSRFETVCSYDRCFADADCDGACLCRGAGGGAGSFGANRCVSGDCATDADCGPGGYCSPSLGDCGGFGGIVGFYCRTCEDECLNDSDCTAEMGPFGGPGYCAYNPAVGHWACSYQQCAG